VPYTLHVYDRDPKSGVAPPYLKKINPFGTAPYFRDTTVSPPVSLSESGAIVDYILAVHGGKTNTAPRLIRTPDDKDYGAYLQWLHFANGSLQPSVTRLTTFLLAGMWDDDSPIVQIFHQRNETALKLLDERLADSNNKFLAGEHLSAADIMTVCSLTTLRGFAPMIDLGTYPNILRYLRDVAARPAYLEALRKGDVGLEPMIQPRVKGFVQFEGFRPFLERFN
jgi:glutathione S-transferase